MRLGLAEFAATRTAPPSYMRLMNGSKPRTPVTPVPWTALCASLLALGCGDASTGQGGGGSGAGGESEGGSAAGFQASYPLDAQFPEGGTFSASEGAFFVGSLGDGSIHRIDAATGEQQRYFEETADGAWWSLGMAVDEERRRLWVCAMEDLRETDADPQYDGYVWSFDLVTGERDLVIALADADPEGTCTDVAVASDGTVYVTDRDFGNVYAVKADGSATVLTSDPLLEGDLVGQNTAVILPDESAILIAVYLDPRLVRVDLASGVASEVTIEGTFGDSAALLAGADGMTYAGGALYVAFASRLVKVTPDSDGWSSATATGVDVTEGMTDVIATPNGLYLLNGQAVRYAFEQPTDPFALTLFEGGL